MEAEGRSFIPEIRDVKKIPKRNKWNVFKWNKFVADTGRK